MYICVYVSIDIHIDVYVYIYRCTCIICIYRYIYRAGIAHLVERLALMQGVVGSSPTANTYF